MLTWTKYHWTGYSIPLSMTPDYVQISSKRDTWEVRWVYLISLLGYYSDLHPFGGNSQQGNILNGWRWTIFNPALFWGEDEDFTLTIMPLIQRSSCIIVHLQQCKGYPELCLKSWNQRKHFKRSFQVRTPLAMQQSFLTWPSWPHSASSWLHTKFCIFRARHSIQIVIWPPQGKTSRGLPCSTSVFGQTISSAHFCICCQIPKSPVVV